MQRFVPENPASGQDEETTDTLQLKNEIPEDPITTEFVTHLKDPILFQDGQIYSYSALTDYFKYLDSKGEAHRSPWTNLEVKPTLISPANNALKDFIKSFNELKDTCNNLIEENGGLLQEIDDLPKKLEQKHEQLNLSYLHIKKTFKNNIDFFIRLKSLAENKHEKKSFVKPITYLKNKKTHIPLIKSDKKIEKKESPAEIKKINTEWIRQFELKNEIPTDIISMDPVTEIIDPILFQDGQFYSYASLNHYFKQLTDNHKPARSPWTNQEVKPILVSKANHALKDFLASFEEMKKLYKTLKKQNEALQKNYQATLEIFNPMRAKIEHLVRKNEALTGELVHSKNQLIQFIDSIGIAKTQELLIPLATEQDMTLSPIPSFLLDYICLYKYKFVDGIMKLNPLYTVEKNAIIASPSKALTFLSSLEDVTHASDAKKITIYTPLQLTAGTTAAMELIQDKTFLKQFKLGEKSDGGELLEKITSLLAKHEIPIGLLNKLLALSKYKLNFIIDDSGSMNMLSETLIQDSSPYLKQRDLKGPRSKLTRWEEVEDRIHIMLDLLSCIPTGPITIGFLNRRETLILEQTGKNPDQFIQAAHQQISALFMQKPFGTTPLYTKLSREFKTDTPTMHYVFTDGIPSDAFISEVSNLISKRQNPQKNPLTLISCTDEEGDAEWMTEMAEKTPYTTKVNDFISEKISIEHNQGAAFPYSRGFWLVSQLVSAINPNDLGMLDESIPFNKNSLNNLLGHILTTQEYKHYFEHHPQANQYKELYSQFVRDDVTAKKILPTSHFKSMLGLNKSSNFFHSHVSSESTPPEEKFMRPRFHR